jgi:protein involved in polysaccharide export with SLBB domain
MEAGVSAMKTINARRAMALIALWTVVGCTSLQGIPANRLPPPLMGERRNDRERIDYVRLRQDPPDVYLLAARDILGVYVGGVYGSREKGGDVPPTHFPESGNMPPSIGYPTAVREDGTISLPQVPPIKVEGLTVAEAEIAVRRAYTEGPKKILEDSEDAQIIVTLMRPRTYQVIVIREDRTNTYSNEYMQQRAMLASANPNIRNQQNMNGNGALIDLKAYENDVLTALMMSGGLPDENAKNEVVILRGSWSDAAERDRLLLKMRASQNPCDLCRTHHRDRWGDDPNVLRIPLRFDASNAVEFDEDSIILREGDVVLVESRDRDVFYTGGLLPGGAFLLPRDRDINVLEAIALAGGSIGGGPGSSRSTGVFGGGGLGALIPPSECIIVRNFDDCGSVNIKVNLNRALNDQTQRLLIQPGDTIILRYTTGELIGNIFLSTVNFNFLFNGFSGNSL